MLQPGTLGAVALLGLLAGSAASADDHRYARDEYYRSAPQVRVGVDLIWGGYGYAPPRPPMVWYPPYYYAYDRHADYDQGHGHGHRRHRHHPHRWDDCDD